MTSRYTLPLSQIALSSIDIERSETWWREGLGFLPSANTRIFRGKSMSSVVQLENAATTTRWFVGQDDWLQIEMWHYENPLPRLTLTEAAPNRVGFSRCGVWVKDFDGTLNNLILLGSAPLTAPTGDSGERRVAIRDPDGIIVELFEKDPLHEHSLSEKFQCNAAFRSITLTTDDMNSSKDFIKNGLGLDPHNRQLHSSEHEYLWCLPNAICDRETYKSGSMLLELVHYHQPATEPRPPHSRLNDQGILNVAFGDPVSRRGIKRMEKQALKEGGIASGRMNNPLIGGCVYITDPRGFSFELLWSHPGLGHRLMGYIPNDKAYFSLPTNQHVKESTWVDCNKDKVNELLDEILNLPLWPQTTKRETLKSGVSKDNRTAQQDFFQVRFSNIIMEITEWLPGKSFRFRTLRGGHLKNCLGEVKLSQEGVRIRIDYTLRFRSNIPGTGYFLKTYIKRHIKKQLNNLAVYIK